jgi:hypothetical protein
MEVAALAIRDALGNCQFPGTSGTKMFPRAFRDRQAAVTKNWLSISIKLA